MIKIDGSFGEGGGQIIRTAIALSVITQKPCHIFNVRQKRENPGLKTQHLISIEASREISNGKTEGVFLNSKEIFFYPGKERKRKIHLKIPTAASITLLLQTILPIALFSPYPVEISIDGGATDTFFSPTLDYFRNIFLQTLKKIGGATSIEVKKRGFYPEGGAKIKVEIYPIKEIAPFEIIERGNLEKISIYSGASKILEGRKVSQRQISGAKEIIGKLKLPIEERINYFPTSSPGSYICITAKFQNTILGTDNLGKIGKSAELIGREAAAELLKEESRKASLDKHLVDHNEVNER